MKKYRILILDFGSQYTQLLLRRIRELGVYSALYCWDVSESQIFKFNPAGIILSGGPYSSTSKNSPYAPKCIYHLGVPILGICYGMQIMSVQLGGKVNCSNLYREFGCTKITVLKKSILMDNIYDFMDKNHKAVLNVWMSHEDTVTIVPKNFSIIAMTESSQVAVISNEEKNFYGIQFHPEVTHTEKGNDILRRFILKICKCNSFWKPKNIINTIVSNIRIKVKYDGVILGISGGIDSLITALLLQRAIGCQLTCVMIDTGLLRYNEVNNLINFFQKNYNLNIVVLCKENQFFDALYGIQDPEMKRKVIGKMFVKIFEEYAKKIVNIKWLAQGTIYSDIIESGNFSFFSNQNIIKSHHNVGGLPKNMDLRLLEPIKYLFKDEVRKIGLDLGIPYDIVYRHPFPGPGLAIRILGEVKREYCDLIRRADSIFLEELHRFDLYKDISQAFSVFLPIYSVGIQGDRRKYGWVISLRAVKTVDFMTARWVHFSHNFLEVVSSRIINEIQNISRVVYDISNKPPATVEWE